MVQRNFEVVKGESIEGDYWKPSVEGDNIEGTIIEFKDGTYGEQIVLQLEDESLVELPSHKNIMNKYKGLYENDYIRVTLTGFKKSNDPDFNDTPLYKVEIDRSGE
jgi:hypothetical protein